jgi:hypothetical protein
VQKKKIEEQYWRRDGLMEKATKNITVGTATQSRDEESEHSLLLSRRVVTKRVRTKQQLHL